MILDAQVSRPTEGGASFSLYNRLCRLAWNVTWALLASWTPPVMAGWRRFLLRSFGAKISPTAMVYSSAIIWYPPYLTVGHHATIGPGARIYCQAPVDIGDYAIVSQRAHLCAGEHDIDDPHFQLVSQPIRLEARAWVAAEAFVGPGVTVAEGAVLGARGVAFKDLAAWHVYAGNPAKMVRRRANLAAPLREGHGPGS